MSKQVARAATATATNLYPTADVGGVKNNFATPLGTPTNGGSCVNNAHHCNYVDSNDTGTSTGLSTGTLMDATTAIEEFDMQDFTPLGTFKQITTVSFTITAGVIGGSCASTCDNFSVRLYAGGGYNGTTNTTATLTTSFADYTTSWSGLAVTNATDTRIEITRVAQGTGAAGSKDDNVEITQVKADITYTYTAAPANFTQEGYEFENDDLNGATAATAQAGSQFSGGPTTLANVPQGERTNLRMHIKNASSGAITSDVHSSLFYDRGDNIWTKVNSVANPGTTPSGSQDCQGFDGSGGSPDYYCTGVYDGSAPNGGYQSEILTNPVTGIPTMVFSYGNATTPERNLALAQYVGSNGNCSTFVSGGSSAWQCKTIFDGTSGSDVTALDFAISPLGDMWIAFNNSATGNDLVVAKYALASGQNCDTFDGTGGDDFWACTTVFDGGEAGDVTDLALAVDSSGTPYVAFNNVESTTDDVVVAKYVGSGGNCNTFDSATLGSTAWQCTTVYNGAEANDGAGLDMVINGSGNPVISFKNEESTNSDLIVATYVGTSGQTCGNNLDGGTAGSGLWDCTTVFDGGENGDINWTNININAAGQVVVAFSNYESTGGELWYATLIGTTGQNCGTNLDGGTAGSGLWSCERVYDGNETADAQYMAMAMDPSGAPWIVFNDDETVDRVVVAHRVGSGGNCSNTSLFDGGSSAWQCDTLFEDSSTNTAPYPSITMNNNGNPMISFTDQATTNPNIIVADMRRSGEILAVKSHRYSDNASLTTSRADMTSVSDTTNRDNANCMSASTWNNGKYFATGEGQNFALVAGNVTSQCTELMWTLDTSQATPGTTYRFIYTVSDNWRRDKGEWRGPGTISTYPSLTMNGGTTQNVRYSKGINQRFANTCASFVDTGGSANWDCQNVIDGNSTNDFLKYDRIVMDQNGVPNFVAKEETTSGRINIIYGEYVGSGGNCNSLSTEDTGGSSEWNCVNIVNGSFSADFDAHASIAIGPNNEKYIWFEEEDQRTVVAQYVGTGGDCDTATADGWGGSNAWKCTIVWKGSSARDFEYWGDMAVSPTGIPYLLSEDQNGTGNTAPTDIMVAYYVGANGNCDTFDAAVGSDAWQCETVLDGSNLDDFSNSGSIAFTKDGRPVISTYDYSKTSGGAVGNNLLYIEYVGSGGNCTTYLNAAPVLANTDAWQCSLIVNGNSALNADFFHESTVGVDKNGTPYIVSLNDMVPAGGADGGAVQGNNLFIAKYVGGSSGTCASYDDTGGSTAWDCTTIIGGNSDNDFEYYSSLAFDKDGNPWVMATAYNETGGTTGNNIIVAHYVGSGGNCASFVDTGGSNAWSCETVINGNDTTDFFYTGKIAFDRNDVPWISTYSYNTALNTTGNNMVVAKLATPYTNFSTTMSNVRGAGNSDGMGDYQYRLTAGRSPYNDSNGNCEGSSTYGGYCALRVDDGYYDSITSPNGYGMPYYGMAAQFTTNTVAPQLIWTGTTNLSPTSGTITMQLYNYSTATWDTVASTSSACTGNCKLTGMIATSTPSNYYTTATNGYTINARVFQAQNGSTAITFQTDSFIAEQQNDTMHQGSFFSNGNKMPLNRRR